MTTVYPIAPNIINGAAIFRTINYFVNTVDALKTELKYKISMMIWMRMRIRDKEPIRVRPFP